MCITMSLYIRCITNKTTLRIDVPFDKDTTVGDMKKIIESKYGIPIKDQVILMCGKTVSNEDELRESGFFEATIIFLKIDNSGG